MKRLCVIALVIFAFAPLALGQKEQADERTLKESLIKLEKQSWEAWKKRDGKFYNDFLSDNHLEVGGGGIGNKAEIVAFVGSPVCVVNSYSVDNFTLTVFDAKTALLTYHAEQDTTCGGKPVPSPAWVSSLYVRRGKRWLNAFYQQTPTRK
jgi:hypothetical protein